MAVAAGKTNAKFITIDIDDYADAVRDISLSITDVSIPVTFDTADVTGYSDGVTRITTGHANHPLTMTGVYDTEALVGAHTVLSRLVGVLETSTTITIQIGIRAAPVAGMPEYEGLFFCTSLVYSGDLTFTAEFVPATTVAPAWQLVV